jgi:hypothetical protein
MEEPDINWFFDIKKDVLDPYQSSYSPFRDITKLPTELWVIIIKFATTKAIEPLQITHYPYLKGYTVEIRTLINITHTCRYLRNLALDNAVLWSEIDLDHSERQFEVYLGRSKQALLVAVSTGPLPRERGKSD